MAQYGIATFAPAPADPMNLTDEYVALLEEYPAQIERLGGTVVTGFAFEASTTATSVRGDLVTGGPFGDGTEVLSGFFVLEAPDRDVALRIAMLNPAARDGAVEVRPLFSPPAQ